MVEDINALRIRLKIYKHRLKLLYFLLLSNRFNSRLRIRLNKRGEFHLNNCEWSVDDIILGPDTCHCYIAISNPDAYFENQTKDSSDISTLYPMDAKDFKMSIPFSKDESNCEFYFNRLLDFEGVPKWYEAYKSTVNPLNFQIKVRELKKEDEIDAIDNSEWHLTDCLKCVDLNKGPATCHCQKAMENPWKYLKEKYSYIDFEKIANKIKKKKLPINYKSA